MQEIEPKLLPYIQHVRMVTNIQFNFYYLTMLIARVNTVIAD